MLPILPPDPPWLPVRTVLLVVHGSRAYGTARPDSDLDLRGVAVAPRRYRDGFLHRFEQAATDPHQGPADVVVFDIRKFLQLCADGNPAMLEVLWVDPADRLVVTPAGQRLLDQRERLLSRKVLHTYKGYALAQLRRIETHRKWLLQPPPHPPTRAAFGLPDRPVAPADQVAAAEAAVRKKVDSWEIDFGRLDDAEKLHVQDQIVRHLAELQIGHDDRHRAAGRLLGYDDNFLDLLDRERKYTAAKRHHQAYQAWREHRNRARADLEGRHGYDTKHALHLVRLLRMGKEILTEGVVRVRRPDAAELLAVRDGAWTYDQLMAWAEAQAAELDVLAARSTLPKSPDLEAIDELCREVTAMLPDE